MGRISPRPSNLMGSTDLGAPGVIGDIPHPQIHESESPHMGARVMPMKNPARALIFSLAGLAALVGDREAKASPTYTVTDLGSSYSFTKDAQGDTISVTGSDGSTYAFNKYPVDYTVKLDQAQDSTGPEPDRWYTVASNKFGSIGYYTHWSIQSGPSSSSADWFTDQYGLSPVHDFNTSGEVVGTHLGNAVLSGKDFDIANANAPGGNVLGLLDEMIPATSNLHLTSSLFIDDFGRIIAEGVASGGTKLEDYLLTPTNLPSATPEPSALTVLWLSLGALAARSSLRRQVRPVA